MADNYFIMVNCLNVTLIPSSNRFLCIVGLTNKKLGIYAWNPETNKADDESFKPHLLDSREAVWNLDVRIG